MAVQERGHNDYRQAFVDAAGHCETNVPELIAAIGVMTERLDTGAWPKTDAAALNAAAGELNLETSRFVD